MEDWGNKDTQERYKWLNLSPDQAVQTGLIESASITGTRWNCLSTWEEHDYLLDSFRRILDDEQYTAYAKWRQEHLDAHEKWLIEQDEKIAHDLKMEEERIEW